MPLLMRAGATGGTALLLAGCAVEEAPSMLQPSGFAARVVEDLWWLMFWLGAAVFVLVTALLVIGPLRGRRKPVGDGAPEPSRGPAWIVLGGVVLPLLVLPVVYGATILTLAQTSDFAGEDDLQVEVTANTWWWDVRYPASGFTTANEIVIPVDRPVQMVLKSNDVIHSFWVPQLAGKIDNIPGRTNTLSLQADEPGVYRGQCAEYCGTQHSRMQFFVRAVPEAEFEQWLLAQRRPADVPDTREETAGALVFNRAGCAACHTVSGTAADGQIGPDLTHLMSRETIGAGTLPNTKGYLGGWVLDPQQSKPGAKMPPTPLDPQELEALLAYLTSLE